MPVPWEALIPFGMIVGLFGVAGGGMSAIKHYQNDWKPPRYGIDRWDEMMMERDRRLTGSYRGQRTDPVAPKEFATNSSWESETVRA